MVMMPHEPKSFTQQTTEDAGNYWRMETEREQRFWKSGILFGIAYIIMLMLIAPNVFLWFIKWWELTNGH